VTLRWLRETRGVEYVLDGSLPTRPPLPESQDMFPEVSDDGSNTRERAAADLPPSRTKNLQVGVTQAESRTPESARPLKVEAEVAVEPQASRADERTTGSMAGAGELPIAATSETTGLRERAQAWTPAEKLDYLRRKNLGDCRRCGLCQTRKTIVFGVGDPSANLMFVGEAPGADEDRQGIPFVGRAGERLNLWIANLGLRREDVYIANVLKCRPPNNRDPNPDEVDKCAPFLKAQIRAIEPKVLVALGRHAGMLLSGREELSLRAMRSARLTYDAGGPADAPRSRLIPLIVTYHPAYVLRQEGSGSTGQEGSATALVMQDLQRAMDLVR